jgi:hypothetical protein
VKHRAFVLALALSVAACSKSYRVGDHVLVEWEGADYPAAVQAVEGPGKYRIHFEGYDPIWDESVPIARIKRKLPESGSVPSPPPPAKVRARMASGAGKTQLSTFKIGDRVKVDWKGTFYPATILVVLGGERYRVHYEGYDQNFDENVDISRIQRK